MLLTGVEITCQNVTRNGTYLPEKHHSASNRRNGFTGIVAPSSQGIPDAGNLRKEESSGAEDLRVSSSATSECQWRRLDSVAVNC